MKRVMSAAVLHMRCAGDPLNVVIDMPSGCSTRFVEVLLERHSRCVGHGGRRHLDARVGVDPRPFRSGDRLRAIEAVATGVAQQVPQRAARLTDGLVERNDALFDGDEACPRGDRLGDGGNAKCRSWSPLVSVDPLARTTATATLSTGHESVSRSACTVPPGQVQARPVERSTSAT